MLYSPPDRGGKARHVVLPSCPAESVRSKCLYRPSSLFLSKPPILSRHPESVTKFRRVTRGARRVSTPTISPATEQNSPQLFKKCASDVKLTPGAEYRCLTPQTFYTSVSEGFRMEKCRFLQSCGDEHLHKRGRSPKSGRLAHLIYKSLCTLCLTHTCIQSIHPPDCNDDFVFPRSACPTPPGAKTVANLRP